MPATPKPRTTKKKASGKSAAHPAWQPAPGLECDDRIIVALEQEYGVSGRKSSGEPIEPRIASELVQEHLKRTLPWLPDERDREGSAYYPWGGRGYIDCGHFEGTTGEAASPAQLLTQVFAMHQAVAAAAHRASTGGLKLCVTSSSVCYHNHTTFGSHLNHYVGNRFLRQQELANRNLLPFFASRILLGPGGFSCDSSDPAGLVLCPRSCFILTDVGGDSTGARPLIHTRGESEPLSLKGSRIHDIALGAPLSPLAAYLRFATSSLVIALIDRGHEPRHLPMFRTQACESMKLWNRDPSLNKSVATGNGEVTALEVQRIYLDFVAEHLKDAPSFAEQSLQLWARLLDELEEARSSGNFDSPFLIESLDWVRKRLIYSRFLETRGGGDGEWDFDRLNRVLSGIPSSQRKIRRRPSRAFDADPAAMLRMIRERRAAEREEGEAAVPKPPKLTVEQQRATELRNQLHALDTQFSDISNPGFGQLKWELAELGIGQPQIDAVLSGGSAAETPTRCRPRGHFIQLWGKKKTDRDKRTVSWNAIIDHRGSRSFSIDDPFNSAIPGDDDRSGWKSFKSLPKRRRSIMTERPPGADASQRVHRALRLYDHGNLTEADAMMSALASQAGIQGGTRNCYLRYWSWICIRSGKLGQALEHLTALYGADRDPAAVNTFRELLSWLVVWRHAGLSAAPARSDFGAWAEAGKRLTNDRRLHDHNDVAALLGHLCLWETFIENEPERGLATAERAASMSSLASLQGFPRQRVWQSIARVQIANHRFDAAEDLLDQAAAKCEERNLHGEQALVHMLRAQSSYVRYRRGEALQFDAVEHLREARAIISVAATFNPVTSARIEAAMARLTGPDDPQCEQHREHLATLCQNHDALSDPLSRTILEHWGAWVAGDPPPPATIEADGLLSLGSSASDPAWWGL